MNDWRLTVMGPPQLTPAGDGADSGAGRRVKLTGAAWVVLASLTLEAKAARREALALRCWPESATARDNLRPVLHYLRKTLGKDAFIEDRETVRLAPGVLTTDWKAARALRGAAGTATEGGERVRLLREAALLLKGEFLEGVDIPDDEESGAGWLRRMRQRANDFAAETLLELSAAFADVGDKRNGFYAAQEAFALAPERADTLDAVIALAQGADERRAAFQLAQKFSLDDLLPTLWERDAKKEPLTVREERALETALSARLRALPKETATAFESLCVFPQSFTAHQAEAITGIKPETLNQLVKANLLWVEAQGEFVGVAARSAATPTLNNRFAIAPPLRQKAWKGVSASRRETLRSRHTRFFTDWVRGAEEWSMADRKKYCLFLQAEPENILLAIEWHIQRPPTLPAVYLILNVRGLWVDVEILYPEGIAQLQAALPYLEMAAATLPPDGVYYAAYAAAILEMDAQNFAGAVRWLRIAQERIESGNVISDLGNLFRDLLDALHHGADDALFDETAAMALRCDPPGKDRYRDGYRAGTRLIIAENYMARGRYVEALPLHEEGTALFERLYANGAEGIPRRAPLRYLRAGILNGLGRTEEARADYNTALEKFETMPEGGHGAASCLRNLAGMYRQDGFHAEARNAVQRAIVLFEKAGDPAAIASCWLVLGDIHRDKGDRPEAERLYRAALTFWQKRDHPRWIAICEARLGG